MTPISRRSVQAASITAVLLSGGLGTRLGEGPKAFARIGNRTFLDHVQRTLEGGGISNFVLVLPTPPPAPVRMPWVLQENVAGGPFASLHRGLHHPAVGTHSVLVFPIDHIAVLPSTVERLAEAVGNTKESESKWFCPQFEGRMGHPVAIGSRLVAEIRRHSSPEKSTLRDFLGRAGLPVTIDVNDAGILENVNTPEDLERVSQRLKTQ